MTLEEYKKLLPPLSDVKKLILNTLWADDSTGFPKPWFSSNKLLQITEQKNFDRRMRDLKNLYGCDLEQSHINGSSSYRIFSDKINQQNSRKNIKSSVKQKLFADSNYTCAVCSQQFNAGLRGLQADHKIPVSRGGNHDLRNFQSLCNNCNAIKRSACSGCEMNCHYCHWAFPENNKDFLLKIPNNIMENIISHHSNKDGAHESIISIIDSYSKFLAPLT